MLAIDDDRLIARGGQGQLARVERTPVPVLEDAQQDLALDRRHRGVPVDVEISGVPARAPVLEDVPPPRVRASGGRHVVGHDVDDQADAALLQGRRQPPETVLPAQLVTDPAGIDDVVAVGAACRGLQHRRAVEVRHAQAAEVGGATGGGIEVEVLRELHAVGAAQSRSRRQTQPPEGACTYLFLPAGRRQEVQPIACGWPQPHEKRAQEGCAWRQAHRIGGGHEPEARASGPPGGSSTSSGRPSPRCR